MSYHNIPDLIAISTHLDHHIWMQEDDTHCTSWMNLFDVAGTPDLVLDVERLNTMKIIESILIATFKEVLWKSKSRERFDMSSPWNVYSTDSAQQGGVQDITDQVFVQHRKQ